MAAMEDRMTVAAAWQHENDGAMYVLRGENNSWLGSIDLSAGQYGNWETQIPRRSGRGQGTDLDYSIRRVEALVRAGHTKAQ